jgi:MFS family permease
VPRNSKPAAILAIILISYFMILLDNSVIFTGLPSIRAGLDLSPTGLSWVQDAYTLVFGGLLLLGARAGDLIGRRRLFVIGLAVFGGASLLIGLAPAGWWMIAARALQGVGAAIVAPTSLALITAYFEGEARSRAVAWYAATAGIGASLGLLVGGALTDLISWRAAFLVNVPIAIAMIVGARAVLTETPRQRGRFDVVGALCATLGMGALVFGIIESGEAGWGSARVVAALVVGVLLLAALVVTESRAAQPVMPLRLFASRVRSGAYAARALTWAR